MSLDKKSKNNDLHSTNLFSYASDEALDGKDYAEDMDDDLDKENDKVKIYDYLDENAVDYYQPFDDDELI